MTDEVLYEVREQIAWITLNRPEAMNAISHAVRAALPETIARAYCRINRGMDNGLDETIHRLGVSSIPYSPLGFGLLTGKYDQSGTNGPDAPMQADIAKYETVRKQRWGCDHALNAARLYNALARQHGMTPTQMALAFCYTRWHVASAIIGMTTVAQRNRKFNRMRRSMTWVGRIKTPPLSGV